MLLRPEATNTVTVLFKVNHPVQAAIVMVDPAVIRLFGGMGGGGPIIADDPDAIKIPKHTVTTACREC